MNKFGEHSSAYEEIMAAFTRDQCGSVPFGSDPLLQGFVELFWAYTVSVPAWNSTVPNWITFTSEPLGTGYENRSGADLPGLE